MRDCRNMCISKDDEPDSYVMGWQRYFDGGASSTNDAEVDAQLFKEGWDTARAHARYVAICGHTNDVAGVRT